MSGLVMKWVKPCYDASTGVGLVSVAGQQKFLYTTMEW